MSALRLARFLPVTKAALTSCTVMAAGDAVCQSIQDRFDHDGLHWQRIANFGIVGLTLHGPMFFWGYNFLDKIIGSQKTLALSVKKAAVNHFTFFPSYVIFFFTYMGLLEGKDLEPSYEKAKAMLQKTWLAGTLIWPAVNTISFKFVPPQYRILYINTVGLCWNVFMSYLNQQPHNTDEIPAEEAML
mmetsp:Transcript_32538/g.59058  ORF Transcript_32538/g.59058 Transcript_32538/m.59058 type:complete len:187 (-) Transcript_32538:766-1326(-)